MHCCNLLQFFNVKETDKRTLDYSNSNSSHDSGLVVWFNSLLCMSRTYVSRLLLSSTWTLQQSTFIESLCLHLLSTRLRLRAEAKVEVVMGRCRMPLRSTRRQLWRHHSNSSSRRQQRSRTRKRRNHWARSYWTQSARSPVTILWYIVTFTYSVYDWGRLSIFVCTCKIVWWIGRLTGAKAAGKLEAVDIVADPDALVAG